MTGKDSVRDLEEEEPGRGDSCTPPLGLTSPALTDLLSSFWPSRPRPCPEFRVSVHGPQTSWWARLSAGGHRLPVVTLNISPDCSHLLSLGKGKPSGVSPDAKDSGRQRRPCRELALPFKVKPLASGLPALGTPGIPFLHPWESDLPGLFSQVS